MISDREKIVSQTSGLTLQENTSAVIGRSESTLEPSENEEMGEEVLSEEYVGGKSRSHKTSSKLSDSSEKKLTESLDDIEQEKSLDELGEEVVQSKGESEENVKEELESGVEEEAYRDVTLLGSRMTGLGISRQVSPGDWHEQILEAITKENLVKVPEGAAHVPPAQPNPYEDWSNKDWLKIAARQRDSRRSRKKDDIALRKEKYPELYRSDVSIHPSYTDVQLPYFAVAHQRYLRALRRIHKQIRGDIEEMTLLQPRALDGVRIIRTFCQGAAPEEKRHTLNPKDRRRLEYLLAGNIY